MDENRDRDASADHRHSETSTNLKAVAQASD